MKKVMTFALILLITGFVMSCGKGGETPADVVKAFTMKVENGDAAAKDYFSKELAAMFEDEKFKQAMDEKTQEMKDKGGVKELTINEEKIDGENATVTYTLTYGNGETEQDTPHVIQEDGKWKMTISK